MFIVRKQITVMFHLRVFFCFKIFRRRQGYTKIDSNEDVPLLNVQSDAGSTVYVSTMNKSLGDQRTLTWVMESSENLLVTRF